MQVINLKLFPPSANHRLIYSYGRLVKSPKYRDWQRKVLIELQKLHLTTVQGQIYLFIEVFMPDRRKRDLDNLAKCLQDVLTLAKAYEDDSQIAKLIISNAGVDKTKGINIGIWTVEEYNPLDWSIDGGKDAD